MTSLYQINLPLSVEIFQHHQRKDFTFHNSCSILEYKDFLVRAQFLTKMLLKQSYVAPKLKSSLQKLYGRHHDLDDCYEISISQMTMDLLLFM
jgi:hypothetical protein